MLIKIFHRLSAFISLRVVLLVPFLVLLISTVAIIIWLSLNHSHKAINSTIRQLHTETAARIKQHLQQYLETPKQVTRQMADIFEFGLIKVNDLEKISQLFWKKISTIENMSYIQFSNTEGEMIAIERHHNQNFTLDITNRYSDYDMETYPLDMRGKRSKSEPLYFVPLYDAREQDWYKTTRWRGEPVWTVQDQKTNWGDIFNFFGKSWLSITLTVPVYDSNRKLLGVTGADFTLQNISAFLKTLKVSKNAQTFIIERSGHLIATSTNESLSFTDEMGKIRRLKPMDYENKIIRKSSEILIKKFGDFNAITNQDVVSIDINRQRYLVKIEPFVDHFGLDWVIVLVVPESDFMQDIQTSTELTLSLSLVALLLAILVGLIISNWVIQPVQYLSYVAQQVADGQWDYELPLTRHDELGDLARSFHRMAKDLRGYFNSLEEKVSARTEEIAQQAAFLAEANAEICRLNEQLQAENVRMESELQVTRRLQQMVLPCVDELENIAHLDIASEMMPATEVGGDYYDVLKQGGVIKIAIGDVTGHGLESGVLMMMVQTAIRTMVLCHLQEPQDFVRVLNRVVYENVRRMGTDKSLTFCLLDYFEGRVRVSGQHEDILLVRGDGKIEKLETFNLGFILGIEADIGDFIRQVELCLQRGEGLVLYTDGIIEAMNSEHKQYGMNRLCRVVSGHWHLSVQEVKAAIIADLQVHLGLVGLQDDVTLLVIKQMD